MSVLKETMIAVRMPSALTRLNHLIVFAMTALRVMEEPAEVCKHPLKFFFTLMSL